MEGELPKDVATPLGAVFLSYASQDVAAAAQIRDALQSAGVSVWFDQSELRGGDVWDQTIRRQIRDCALFVPVISLNTASRHEGYFRLEWDLADQRSRMMARDRTFIVPVCLDSTPAAGTDIPESFHRVQWTRLPGGAAPSKFAERIASLLSRVPPSARTAPPAPLPPFALGPPDSASSRWKLKAPFWIAMAVILAVLIGVIDKFDVLTFRQRAPTTAAQIPLDTPAATKLSEPLKSTATAIPDKSIAVLPFLDMSERHDQEYFSDGLTEELIDRLAQAPDLKVIARTSSFYFRSKQATISEIGRTLAVTHVLEGSVRKSGKTLRISAQLVRATDGVHVWSQTFDRQLVDLFKLQSELAGTVAQALAVALDINGKNPAGNESTLEAYNLRLEADFVSRRRSRADTELAINLYKKALALDPHYALAWANLGHTYLNLMYYGMEGSETIAGTFDRARDALDHALRVDPNLGTAYELKGDLFMLKDLDWPKAAAAFHRAGELDPTFSAERALAPIWRAYGRADESIDAYRRALSRDPVSASLLMSLGWSYLVSGRLEEAVTTFGRTLELAPSYASAKALQAEALLLQGKKNEALEAVEQETDPAWKISISPIVYWDLGRRQESDAALNTLEEKFAASSAFNIAQMHAYRGEIDDAFRWLERAYRQRDGMLYVKLDPLLRRLHGDPRFQALLVQLKLDGRGPESL